MRLTGIIRAGVVAWLALATQGVAQEGAEPQGLGVELKLGVEFVEEGNFEAGIEVLDALVTEIGEDLTRSDELSTAYLYLGIAYLGLSEGANATARFVDAVRLKSDLQLNPREFPPRIIDAFEQAREKALEQAAGALPAPTPPAQFGVFIEAVKAGDFAAVSRLLDDDPSLVNWADEEFGATALHWCALRGHEAIAALLLGRGAQPSKPNHDGETAVQVARRSKHDEVVRLLKQVESPIYEAARLGNLAEVRRQVDADPTVLNRPDAEFGATPLHWAALKGHVAVVSFLINSGADPQKRNAAGETPLEVARREGHGQVIVLLGGPTAGS